VAAFPHLFEPLTIGSCVLRNRVVSSGHDTVMAENGQVTDRLIAYHEARAEGGVGLIIVQVAGVHESARYTSHTLMATDDSCIDGYERLARALHERGAKVFAQLFHPGREVMESQDGSRPVALAPSPVSNERFRVMPRALRVSEISEIVDGYASAADRVRRAGLDGIEIVASHGYLPAQFLNERVNRRVDEYGGSAENRLRFLREVLASTRHRVGDGFVVGLRMSLGEEDPAGLEEAVALDACVRLADENLVDYLSVTVGTSAGLAGSDHIAPDMHFANGYTVPLADRLKARVRVPVLVAGRINQPQEAERILAEGRADACIMTRALISDPDLARLAESGRAEEIRACVGCNQACIGHFHLGFPISCIQHPETGRERRFAQLTPASVARRVLVVGAGPAGLKAAAVAASRGHEVVVHESEGLPGGQVLLAQLLPERDEFGGVALNLSGEARRAGAQIITHSEVTTESVAAQRPDVVIVATGARPYRPSIEVVGDPAILDAWQVLRGQSPPAGHTVVIDTQGDWIAIGVARTLAAQGHPVTLCVTGYAAGESLQQYVRDVHLAALSRERVNVVPLVRLFGVDDDSVYLQHVLTGEMVILSDVAGVVLACGAEPVNELLESLLESGVNVIGVGDCLAPRNVEEAVLEGLVAASTI